MKKISRFFAACAEAAATRRAVKKESVTLASPQHPSMQAEPSVLQYRITCQQWHFAYSAGTRWPTRIDSAASADRRKRVPLRQDPLDQGPRTPPRPVPDPILSPTLSSRNASLLCYIPLRWLDLRHRRHNQRKKFRRETQVRFHAFQGLYIFVAWLMVDWVISPILSVGSGFGFPHRHFTNDIPAVARRICRLDLHARQSEPRRKLQNFPSWATWRSAPSANSAPDVPI